MNSKRKIHYLKIIANNFKVISSLRKEFDVDITESALNIYLKKEYNNSDDYKYIKVYGEDIIVVLSDVERSVFDKNINLYIGNTVVNSINGIHKVKSMTVLTGDVPIFLESYNVIYYENVYIDTTGKLTIGAVDIDNNLIVKAKEIEINSDSYVNSKNQCYIATTMNVKYGYLDATGDIEMHVKNLTFHRSGVFAKNLSINSENVLFSRLQSFDLDNFEINSDTIDNDGSMIITDNNSISASLDKFFANMTEDEIFAYLDSKGLKYTKKKGKK